MEPGYIIFSLAIICAYFSNISCDYDYYWRDYTGIIPGDAVEGGRDINNKTTYIGQVYVSTYALIPVTIYPGLQSVTANIIGMVTHLNSYIQILCSPSKENFKWLPTDSKRFHMQTINKHVVPGGVEQYWDTNTRRTGGGVSNIGRIMYQGELLVAKVSGFDVGNAKLFFPAAGHGERSAESYEVLIYDGPDLNSTKAQQIL